MHRASYWKTTILALCCAGSFAVIVALALGNLSGFPAMLLAGIIALPTAAALLIAAGGLICLWRDARIAAGRPDLFDLWPDRVPRPGLLSRLGMRFLFGSAPRPGDLVRVKSLAEIRQTLDADGTLEGLPFMDEMQACCGGVFVVHRRVDKINDMRHKTGLRRMHGAVTLSDVRCSGVAHGGCQAECQIIWKDAWLTRPIADTSPLHTAANSPAFSAASPALHPDHAYVCQITRLWEASRPMSRLDIRQDLRPLLSGNIAATDYAIALLTRLFNRVQALRGGIDFPAMPVNKTAVAPPEMPLADGQPVFVRRREEIAVTLKKSRNRGLWFDRDMVRFSGQPGVLRKHVTRVIHEASGKMVVMKTPSVVLDRLVATGEFLRLCPQHEYIFWREVWLRPATDDGTLSTSAIRKEVK